MRYIRTATISIFLLLITLLIAPTAFAQTEAMPQNRQKLGGTEPSAHITREVMHELLMLPYYSVFDDLAFKVDGGDTVTLYGAVTNPVLKSDAENAVKRIEGVEKVTNNIEVLPLSPNDNRIRHAAYRAIYGFGPLNRYSWGAWPSIHILVKNGHITLRGVVDNENDKNLAGIRANGVSGAFSVTNELEVANATAEKQKPQARAVNK